MEKPLHFNKPQLRSMLVGAPVEYLIAGRGTGKTEGVLAPKTANVYFKTMPRATGVFLGATYNQLLTRTLPGLLFGWERLGYIQGVHFLIGKTPTDKWKKMWNWKGPYRPPLSYQYFVSWFNGAGAHLVSQDRSGSSNGITIDWIIGDELKLINEEKLRTELLPANRGIIPEFANNPYHHGMTFTTDMPVGTSGRWILEMEQKCDKKRVAEILKLQNVIYQLKKNYHQYNKPIQATIDKQIAVLEQEINELRFNLLYFHEASTLENIHALGVDYIKQQMRDTTQFMFDTQILNIRPVKIEDGFYPDFDEEVHGYFAANHAYLDSLEYNFDKLNQIDCRRDGDLLPNQPLHIAIDYNRRIHPLVVSQVSDKYINVINGLYVLYPLKLKDVLQKFVEYYAPHKRKVVYYWYDHTAVGDMSDTRICDYVISYLRKAGWVVIPMYTNKAPGHESKYRMYGDLLQNNGKYKYEFKINRENCDKLILSMYQAPAELRKDGFGKDKSSEKDNNFPAEESTHFSDALDMLIYGILESKLPFKSETKGGGGILIG